MGIPYFWSYSTILVTVCQEANKGLRVKSLAGMGGSGTGAISRALCLPAAAVGGGENLRRVRGERRAHGCGVPRYVPLDPPLLADSGGQKAQRVGHPRPWSSWGFYPRLGKVLAQINACGRKRGENRKDPGLKKPNLGHPPLPQF